jgi:hypothetical protein
LTTPSTTAATGAAPSPSIILPRSAPRSHHRSDEEVQEASEDLKRCLLPLINRQLPAHERQVRGIELLKTESLSNGAISFALSPNSLAYESTVTSALASVREGAACPVCLRSASIRPSCRIFIDDDEVPAVFLMFGNAAFPPP